MTEPGHVAPASPGWWVRTNRVGTNANTYGFSVTATGSRLSLGTAAGTYGWVGTAVGQGLNTQFIGANAAAANSVAIPTHQVGDLIVLCAYNAAGATAPNVPVPGGTVPAWVDIDANTGANANGMRTVRFVATATTTTSGSWPAAPFMIAAVIRRQFSTPIGGHAESGSTSATVAAAPLITMTRTDKSSTLLHFHGHCDVSAWGSAPTGYTRRAAVAGAGGLCLNTKDVTTSDGAVSQSLTGSNLGYRGATVEVLFH